MSKDKVNIRLEYKCMNDLTEEEIHNHQKIVDHNAQVAGLEELALLVHDVPILQDEETGNYYQVVEFEEGEERVDIPEYLSQFVPLIN